MTDGPETRPIDEVRRLRERMALKTRLLAIADKIKENMPDDVTSDHGWLYDDETGLPK